MEEYTILSLQKTILGLSLECSQGGGTSITGGTQKEIHYTIAFLSAPLRVVPIDESNTASGAKLLCIIGTPTKTSFVMGGPTQADGVAWLAVGY